MPTTWLQSLTATPEGMAEYQQERLIVDATERICELMEIQGVSRAELAQRLKKSKSHVSQLLSGRTNMTLRTLSDVFSALGRSLQVADVPLRSGDFLQGKSLDPRSLLDGKCGLVETATFSNRGHSFSIRTLSSDCIRYSH